jgi:hypothetical protein
MKLSICLDGGKKNRRIEKICVFHHVCLVEKKNEIMKNVVYLNLLLCLC